MKRLPLFIFLVCCSSAFGQFGGYSVQVAATFPVIGSVENSDQVTNYSSSSGYGYFTSSATVAESYKGRAGISLSGCADYKFSERFFLTSGVTLNYFRYHRTVIVTKFYPQLPTGGYQPTGTSYGFIYRNWTSDGTGSDGSRIQTNEGMSPPNGTVTAMSLQIPVLAGTTFFKEKFLVRGGPTLGYLMAATDYKQEAIWIVTENNASAYIKEFKDNSREGFNHFSVGAIFEVTYQLTKSIGVDLRTQQNFNPIYTTDRQVGGKAKLNLLSLGARYTLGK